MDTKKLFYLSCSIWLIFLLLIVILLMIMFAFAV